jgi:hypothetical protein
MTPIPAMKILAPLVGSWKTVIRWSEETHKLVGGRAELDGVASFEWMDGGKFLHYHIGPSQWIIGRDDLSSEFAVLYSDDREVARIYRMTFGRGIWKIWRNAPGFHQRFEGRFTQSGRTIHARWERSTNGKSWTHDFDMTYTKTRTQRS